MGVPTLLPIRPHSRKNGLLYQRTRLITERDLLRSQNPVADVERIWESTTLQLNSEVPKPQRSQASEFYDDRLRRRLEPNEVGKYVAMHPESQGYVVRSAPGKAFRAMRAKQPTGKIVVRLIGLADEGLRTRLWGDQSR